MEIVYKKLTEDELDIFINSNDKCIPHIVNVSLKNIKSETMLHALEKEKIYCENKKYKRS